jgi:transposase-like protein
MHWIVPAIASLKQHLKCLAATPAMYRPPQCPTCGFARLWAHGSYDRKADRRGGALNPIPVPRYKCTGCRGTCSSLPACLSPRRWYDWAAQQGVLLLMLAGASVRSCAKRAGSDRRTVRRWWQNLQTRHLQFDFFLIGRSPELGRADSWHELWQRCLTHEPLSAVMAWLHRQGVAVP